MDKIVYFDEESVTDYVQIVFGGQLEKTTELLKDTQKGVGVDGNIKVSGGISGIFKTLLGFEASTEVNSNAHISFKTDQLVKNILQNTILTDFLDMVHKDDNNVIEKFKGYKISVEKDSLSYFVMISPYMTMLSDTGNGIPSGEFNIAIDKIDDAIRLGKGYYEFLGRKNKKEIVFRFNINAFKNNYKISDLLKMKLTIYAIYVGDTTLDQLNFNKELGIEEKKTKLKDNPTYEKLNLSADIKKRNKHLKVFDVVLAGVDINGE